MVLYFNYDELKGKVVKFGPGKNKPWKVGFFDYSVVDESEIKGDVDPIYSVGDFVVGYNNFHEGYYLVFK